MHDFQVASFLGLSRIRTQVSKVLDMDGLETEVELEPEPEP